MIFLNEKKIKKLIREAIGEIFKEESDNDILEKVFHWSLIPDEELEMQYWNLSAMVSMSGYGGPFMGVDGKILKEEATYTMSIYETKQIISQKFKLEDWQIGTLKGMNEISLMFLIPNIDDNIELLNDGMAACGWCYSNSIKVKRKNMDWIALTYDPMFQENVATEAKEYRFLYHWTPEYKYSRIKREGLWPRSENFVFKYPNRLHLLNGDLTDEQMLNIGWQLFSNNKEVNNNGRYVLLKIDVQSLPDDYKIYYDPRFQGGYYTKEPIPYNFIYPAYGYDFANKRKFPVFG